jgi:general secretion pathway protein M
MKNLKLSSLSLKSISLPFNMNLQPRDRIAVLIAGVVVLIFLIVQLVIFPAIDRRDRLKQTIKTNALALEEIKQLKTEYEASTRNTRDMGNQLKRRPNNFTLFSFIDQLAGTSGIKSNIEYMKPSTANLKNSPYTLSLVEMKISSLTMDQLTRFLHGVENNESLVWIKRISIQKGEKNEALINTTLQVETIQQ